ncbi:MAG: Gfo/Idh/MocA family oxidoreductase [Natronospirillum sp.]
MMNTIKNVLVVGSGAIAKRHIRNIKTLFPESSILLVFPTGRQALEGEFDHDVSVTAWSEIGHVAFDAAIVASSSSTHLEYSFPLAEMGIPVLIEKPIAHDAKAFGVTFDKISVLPPQVLVAYNMRFLSSANKIKQMLSEGAVGRLAGVHALVGQYLPDWRPQKDYRTSVSARTELGGGVLLELSHEFDYLRWLFGDFTGGFCHARTSGLLELKVEDTADVILEHAGGWVANVHLDMLRREPSRHCTIVGEHGTLTWDILNNTIYRQMSGEHQKTLIYDGSGWDRNNMYIDMLVSCFAVEGWQDDRRCTVDFAWQTLQLVDILKESSRSRSWQELR